MAPAFAPVTLQRHERPGTLAPLVPLENELVQHRSRGLLGNTDGVVVPVRRPNSDDGYDIIHLTCRLSRYDIVTADGGMTELVRGRRLVPDGCLVFSRREIDKFHQALDAALDDTSIEVRSGRPEQHRSTATALSAVEHVGPREAAGGALLSDRMVQVGGSRARRASPPKRATARRLER